MMDKPVCSVCIANYNGMRTLAACIDSVLKQDCNLPVEIIVHDDASSDESVNFICEYYPQVVLIESRENVGFCVANNRMAARAQGEFLLLLNNDAELFPDTLSTLYRAAKYLDKSAIIGLPQYDAATGELIDRGSRLDPFLNPVPNLDPRQQEVGMVIGACLWIPRCLWEEIGGFPEWFGSLAEDMYLSCCARLWGYPVQVLSESGFKHWIGNSFGGGKVVDNRLITNRKRRALSERNKNFVMVLCYPTPWLQLFLPFHIVVLLLEGLVVALVKRELSLFISIYLASVTALWKWRTELNQQRLNIQKGHRLERCNFFKIFDWRPYKLRMLLKHGLPTIA
ncbi:MAG: glycosyltransferase [Candidatus Contendobacter sp.]|nr:glycosyltransferase [Candidatus Contendobacter sp.]